MEIDDDQEDQDRGQKTVEVGKLRSVEGLLKRGDLVGSGDEQVEKSNNGSLVLSSGLGSGGDGAEGFPDDGFTDVGGDEEGNPRADTVPLFQHLVKHHDDDAGEGELEDDQNGVSGTDFVDITIHP